MADDMLSGFTFDEVEEICDALTRKMRMHLEPEDVETIVCNVVVDTLLFVEGAFTLDDFRVHQHDASCAFGNPTCPEFGKPEKPPGDDPRAGHVIPGLLSVRKWFRR